MARARNSSSSAGSCLETREGVPYYPFLDVLPALVEAGRSRLGGDPTERWQLLAGFLGGVGRPKAAVPRRRSGSGVR